MTLLVRLKAGNNVIDSSKRHNPRSGTWVYLDTYSGEITAAQTPGAGSFGDVLLQAQLPLHSRHIAGLPGRIAVSGFGLLVAGLSLTGVLT